MDDEEFQSPNERGRRCGNTRAATRPVFPMAVRGFNPLMSGAGVAVPNDKILALQAWCEEKFQSPNERGRRCGAPCEPRKQSQRRYEGSKGR